MNLKVVVQNDKDKTNSKKDNHENNTPASTQALQDINYKSFELPSLDHPPRKDRNDFCNRDAAILSHLQFHPLLYNLRPRHNNLLLLLHYHQSFQNFQIKRLIRLCLMMMMMVICLLNCLKLKKKRFLSRVYR